MIVIIGIKDRALVWVGLKNRLSVAIALRADHFFCVSLSWQLAFLLLAVVTAMVRC